MCFLQETEGGEEKDEAIRRQEQTKMLEGCMKQRGAWTLSGTSPFALNRSQRIAKKRTEPQHYTHSHR